jgi:hypothetical protein
MWDVTENETGTITVDVQEELSDLDLTRLKLSLKQRMARIRATRGSARILFNLSCFGDQPNKLIERFQRVDGEFVQSEADKFALVLRASLDKAAARQLLHGPRSQLFLSANAARTWLAADTA